jgi:hypothetical protein
MKPIPIAPPLPIPPSFEIPKPALSTPAPKVPLWTPIPIYREDLPTPKPKPKEEPSKPPAKNILDSVDEMITPTPTVPPFEPAVPEPTMDTVEVPFTNFEIPVPPQEIMVTAVTTAGASAVVAVGATLAATRVFEQLVKLLKPIFKTILKKLAKLRGKAPAPTWARQRLKGRRISRNYM